MYAQSGPLRKLFVSYCTPPTQSGQGVQDKRPEQKSAIVVGYGELAQLNKVRDGGICMTNWWKAWVWWMTDRLRGKVIEWAEKPVLALSMLHV